MLKTAAFRLTGLTALLALGLLQVADFRGHEHSLVERSLTGHDHLASFVGQSKATEELSPGPVGAETTCEPLVSAACTATTHPHVGRARLVHHAPCPVCLSQFDRRQTLARAALLVGPAESLPGALLAVDFSAETRRVDRPTSRGPPNPLFLP